MPKTVTLSEEEIDLVAGELLAAREATDGDDDPEIVARRFWRRLAAEEPG